MSNWSRFDCLTRQRLYEHVIPLGRTGWYTHARNFTQFGEERMIAVAGFDSGSSILLCESWHRAIENISSIAAYSLQRRTLRQAYGGNDFFGKIIVFEPGVAFYPADRQALSDTHVGDLYDICISFETTREAVLFRMMIMGVVEPA